MTGPGEGAFADEDELRRLCDLLGLDALRGTASPAHERTVTAVEQELERLGLVVRREELEVLRWLTDDLERAGSLRLGDEQVAVIGAVPYSRPVTASGDLVHVPVGEPITEAVRDKVIVRDFPAFLIPYDVLLVDLLTGTPDLEQLRDQVWDRPGFADEVLHQDLLAAGAAGAAGMVVAFDLPRAQLAGYWEPHKGTHYELPAVFVGVDERDLLLGRLGADVELSVEATVEPAVTRNVFATIPGRSDERIVLLTHTDGNTWVQENGPAAVLALASWLLGQPLERTVELAFTTAHLHISREGSQRFAGQLDAEYDDGTVGAVIALEHLGTREIVPSPREDGPGRRLVLTGQAELLVWNVGPSDALRASVAAAVAAHRPARTAVLPGLFPSTTGQLPTHGSLAGVGTYCHRHLVPTMQLISGPWSLWAPSFGPDALDLGHLRTQLLAVADVLRSLDAAPSGGLAGEYPAMRRARADGAPTWPEEHPPQVAGPPEGSST